MKAAFSAIWITLSLLIGFQQALIFMHFKLNRKIIEQEFCVNKSRPELQCHGTCFLKKLMKKANEGAESDSYIIYPWIEALPASDKYFEMKTVLPEMQNQIPFYKKIIYSDPGRETITPPPDSYTRLFKLTDIIF